MIEHRKNKVFKDIPKVIPMGAPICSDLLCFCHDRFRFYSDVESNKTT